MRKIVALSACLTVVACASAPPPARLTTAEILGIPDPVCDEAKIQQIVQQNLPKAMTYPANSAHREVYIETIYTAFDHMKIGMDPLQKRECEIIQKYAILQARLKLEGGG